MMQQPPSGGGASMMDQQQQHQPQPTTTSTAQEEEEEEEFRTLWIGDLQQWMDKVEEKEVRTLWIGELQHWMDEAYINLCFAYTGEVFTSKVIRNKKTGESKCYGFIEFKSHAIAESFLHKFNGTPMPRVALGTTNFSLNWASSFGSGGENQQQQLLQEEEDDDDDDLAAAASDIVTTDFMLPQETFTSVKHLDCAATQFSDEEVNSSWEDMLKWWSIAQGTPTPQEVRATLQVYAIGAFLKMPYRFLEERYLTPTEVEEMLDELPRYVDSIDIAKVLHSIDALGPLISQLCSQHDGIRAKAAKIIDTMAKKYPSSRQLVMEERGEILLYHTYIGDRNPTVQTNALDAISSLFLNGEPVISAFGENGYARLIRVLVNESLNCQRKALNLIARLVEEHNSDYIIVTELICPSIMMRLASSVEAEIRKAALKCLIVLANAEKKSGNSGQLVNNDNLKQALQERMEVISAMDPEEIQLEKSLWNACSFL